MNFLEKTKNKVLKALGFRKPKTLTNPDIREDGYNGWDLNGLLDTLLKRHATDKECYADYDMMDKEIPEIATALNIIADYVIFPNSIDKSETFTVKSEKFQEVCDEITKRFNFTSEFYSIVRDTCKYGDDFEELVPTINGQRFILMKNIPIESVIVNIRNGIINNERYIKQVNSLGEEVTTLSYGETLHFSLNTDRKRKVIDGKGTSLLEKSRLIYRQVRLMEEGSLIRHLSRSNQNYAYLVDVGSLEGDEALDYLDKYKRRIKRRKYVDPLTGRFSYRFNPLTVLEDIFVPTRQGSGANVVNLTSSSNADSNTETLEYFQNKLIYSTGVPKVLIGKENDINSKATADLQFISFLRLVRRIQMIMEPSIKEFYMKVAAKENIILDDLKITWPIIGTIDEERKWKIEQMKMNVMSVLSQDMGLVDDYYIYRNFMNMSDEEINELETRMDETEALYRDEIENSFTPENEWDGTGTPGDQPPKDNEEARMIDSLTDIEKNILKRVCDQNTDPDDKEFLSQFIQVLKTDENIRRYIYQIVELTKLKH